MEQSFGARLRAHRQDQQVALADIAEQSKIKLSLLDGLERGDLSQWPSGIFRRSYVRTYARAIGLDPEAVLREFLERYPDPEEEVGTAIAMATSDGKRRPPTRLRFLLGSALGALRAPARVSEQPVTFPQEICEADDWSGVSIEPADTHAAAQNDPGAAPPQPAVAAVAQEPDTLDAIATLSARLARVATPADLPPVFQQAAELLGAVGLLLWVWDGHGRLRAAVGHGYADDLLLQIGALPPGADNAIGAAARQGDMQVVDGSAGETGALAVPMMTAAGCAGVLAIELQPGRTASRDVCACATILAAQLSALIGVPDALQAATA